ncbi:MAG: hypothetical protein JWO80_1447 [Bryobacterales bacterium]|nr:hypothetical protein [Bryobacterales bacterium]
MTINLPERRRGLSESPAFLHLDPVFAELGVR